MTEIDMAEIKRHVKAIDQHMNELKKLVITQDEEWENTLKRRIGILQEIVENDGIVSYGKYRDIIKKNKMDSRGAGAFFLKCLIKLPDNKVAITEVGKEQLEKWKKEIDWSG